VNLTAATLRLRQLLVFVLIAVAIGGIAAYRHLGQREDPEFTFRVMVMRILWPGASAEQVDRLVTERVTKKLQEIPFYKWTNAYSKPGESFITLELQDVATLPDVANAWYQVRKKLADISYELPPEIQGPFFNDELGDVYGSIYAFTADGYTHSELRDYIEKVRQAVVRLPDVAKADLVGVQDDRIYVEISGKRLGALGIDPQVIARALAEQNAVMDAGTLHAGGAALPVRVTGPFDSVREVQDLRLRAGDRTLRLGDIASVARGYADPPIATVRLHGKPAIALAVSMVPNGDVLRLGADLRHTMERMRAELPLGIAFEQVSDQPGVVKRAVGEFMRSLAEAVAVVLAVSFLALGLRAGLVVALTVPLVLAATFIVMQGLSISLHRISTGALIIALGLLVDDAIIAIEMMERKLGEGLDKLRAATYAYATTAYPMLCGTLVMVAGFLPIATARSTTGEYTFTIFSVTTIALLVSWVAAVTVTPFLGTLLLHESGAGGTSPRNPYDRPFYRQLRAFVEGCMKHRYLVIAATAASFVLGVIGMGLTEKQFFPASNRIEVLVDLWLPDGASTLETEREAAHLEALIATMPEAVSCVTFVGNAPPRFFLTLDQSFYRPNLAQALVLTRDVKGRERLVAKLRETLGPAFPGIRTRVTRVPLGPPVEYPVQFRVIGDDPVVLKQIADELAGLMRAHPATRDVNTDWGNRTLALRVELDQDQARALGVSSASVAHATAAGVSGLTIGQYRENDRLIPVVLRAPAAERGSVAALRELPVPSASGKMLPLVQVASIRETFEESFIRRRNRELTLTVRAEIVDGVQAPDVSVSIAGTLRPLRARLPPGYRIETGGAWEENTKAERAVAAGVPLMIFVILLLLMVQLRSFSRTLMVVLTAPLGVVGVALALLMLHQPFGFVALLGAIALCGMIMRNTVILVAQIDQGIADGQEKWVAIREATVRRFRPIALTAAAAILAMIPLTTSVLWGPMAMAIMGGLVVATILTIVFIPALYAAWFRVRGPAAAGFVYDGILYRFVRLVMRALRRLRLTPAARLAPREADSYAVGISWMLRSRLWTLRRRELRWSELQRVWSHAEERPEVRNALTGALAEDDAIRLIVAGKDGFAARDALYAGAAQSIDIATYYIQSDETGHATIRALAASVARGVRVRLIVDRYMMWKKSVEVEGMAKLDADIRAAGIELRAWHDPGRPFDSNHRKMIVVDGCRALVGGRNFADHYRGDEWRDVDLVLEGPSVTPLVPLFQQLWDQTTVVAGGASLPWIESKPATIRDDPVALGVLSAIGAARRSVDLELAYFVAHDSICGALARAIARGVRVRLLTNSAESNDLPYATWTAYEGARRVLEAGGEVHAWRGAGRTLHPKYVVVDGEWATFGSHNLDYYSPRYCREMNLQVRDARLAGLLTQLFEAAFAQAPLLGLDEVKPWLARHVELRLFDRVFRDFQ
jgi:multidrug efflux pump